MSVSCQVVLLYVMSYTIEPLGPEQSSTLAWFFIFSRWNINSFEPEIIKSVQDFFCIDMGLEFQIVIDVTD